MNALLNECRTDDEYYNMVSMGGRNGKYCIEDKKFWKLYTREIKTSIENNIFTHTLAEKNEPTSYIPVLVDFDKKEQGEPRELYTMDTVYNVMNAYRQVLRQQVPTITDDHLTCIYLSKEPYVISKNGIQYVKHGFHLHFPFIFMQANQQRNILHPKVSLLIEEHQNIDSCIYRTPWLLYGSVKEQGFKPYLIHSIFDYENTVLDIDIAFQNYILLNDEGKKYNHPENHLPKLLSTSSVNREMYCFDPIAPYIPPVIEEVEVDFGECNDDVLRLLPKIKQSFVEDSKKWRALMFVLCGLGVPDHAIHEVCQRTTQENYNEKTTDSFIQAIKAGRYGKIQKTIRHLQSMCDMPKENQDIKSLKSKEQTTQLKVRYDLLRNDHLIIAEHFVSTYGMEYKIIDKNISFKWNKKTLLWEQHETENLPYDIAIIRNDIDAIISMLENSDFDIDIALTAKQNLGNTTFMEKVWKQVYVRLLDKTFMERVNKSPDELPILNGLKLNLRTGEMTKRTKHDLFSVEVWALNKPDLSKVDEYMIQLFHNNTEKIEYLHALFGYWMTGNIEHRRMYFLTGVGRNGKSFLMGLFDRIFRGTYLFCSSIMNCAIIKSDSHHAKDSKPTPELEPFRRARFGVWNELQQGDRISTPLFKTITGGDPLVHRPMYHRGDPIIFTSQMKGIICTNILPEFDIADIACMDRPQVIDFPHRYKSPDELTPEEKAHILFLQSQEFLNMFFWWCVDGAQTYYRTGIPSPACLQVRKDEWIRNLDTTGQFIELTYQKDETKYSGCTEFFQEYIGWCKDNGHKSMNQTQIGIYMTNNGYERTRKSVDKKMKWVYVGLYKTDEDVELL